MALVPNDIIKQIDDIVERSYLGFTHYLLGTDVLTEEEQRKVESLGLIIGTKPLIELLYVLVRQRSEERYQTDQTLQELLEAIERRGILPILNDAQQATVDNAKISMKQSIESTKHVLKKTIKQEIINTNVEEKQFQTMEGVIPLADQSERAGGLTSKLLLGIGAAVLMAQSEFVKNMTSELTDFVNHTVVDEIQTVAENIKEAECYKVVNSDSRLCQWCNSFYVGDNGEPKIYKVRELMANGSNDGKPKSAWKPTIPKTHVRCRCQLHYKP